MENANPNEAVANRPEPPNGALLLGDVPSDAITLLQRLLGRAGPARRAARVAARFGWAQVSRFEAMRWQVEARLEREQAERLCAAFAVGREVECRSARTRTRLAHARQVAELMVPELRGRLREMFYALVVDASQHLIVAERISEGTLSTTPVHPREVFRPALRVSGAALIVVHNHPSGDPEPSAEDLDVTARLVRAGKLLGVPLLDHVILGEGRWTSLRERVDFDRLG